MTPVVDYLPPGDVDVLNDVGVRSARVHELLDERALRREVQGLGHVEHQHICFLADLERADAIIPTERASASDRRHLESDLGGAERYVVGIAEHRHAVPT